MCVCGSEFPHEAKITSYLANEHAHKQPVCPPQEKSSSPWHGTQVSSSSRHRRVPTITYMSVTECERMHWECLWIGVSVKEKRRACHLPSERGEVHSYSEASEELCSLAIKALLKPFWCCQHSEREIERKARREKRNAGRQHFCRGSGLKRCHMSKCLIQASKFHEHGCWLQSLELKIVKPFHRCFGLLLSFLQFVVTLLLDILFHLQTQLMRVLKCELARTLQNCFLLHLWKTGLSNRCNCGWVGSEEGCSN